MSRTQIRIAGMVLAGLLSACSSTNPQSAANPQSTALPTVTPAQRAQNGSGSTAAPANTTATVAATATPSDGPITPSMAKLKLDGERYATLGDPNAPITIVEFSDYG
jgi:protein-disulfide isomerase